MTDPLWNPDAPPTDPHLANLEAALRPLRYRGALPPLPERAPPRPAPRRRIRWAVGLALAAAAALIVAVPSEEPVVPSAPPPSVAWAVDTLEGPAVCPDTPCRLAPDTWLETGPDSTALVTVADIGWMEVGPDSRLRLLSTGSDRHHLELARGTVHAVVDAPPEVLIVDTPIVRAVDLGCAYTLTVDHTGEGGLSVSSGAVALVRSGEEVVVPQGATAPIRVPGGPGIPFQDDAPDGLSEVLDRFELERSAAAADALLALARPEDEVSVFWAWARAPEAIAPRLEAWLTDQHRDGPPVRPYLHADWTPRSPALRQRMVAVGWWRPD